MKIKMTLRVGAQTSESNYLGDPRSFSDFIKILREMKSQPRQIWNVGNDRFAFKYHPTSSKYWNREIHSLRSRWGSTWYFYIKDINRH